MPRPYPKEFREDVIRVARNRGEGDRIKDIAATWFSPWVSTPTVTGLSTEVVVTSGPLGVVQGWHRAGRTIDEHTHKAWSGS